jgi:hypothetical protein
MRSAYRPPVAIQETVPAALVGLSVQDLYDMSPAQVAALPTGAADYRDDIIMEYLRDVSAGFEEPLRSPDAYPDGFVRGLTVDEMDLLTRLQQTRGRHAVIAARREMTRPSGRSRDDGGFYPAGQVGESYGPTVMTCDGP